MMSAHAMVFVLPQGSEAVSGGNIFNQRLIASLSQKCQLRTVEADEWQSQLPIAGITIVDSLNLKEFSRVVDCRVPGQKFILLVHHLPSLEPDMPVKDPSRVLEREVLGLFDGYIVTSSFSAGILRKMGLRQPIAVAVPPLMVNDIRDSKFTWPPRALMASNLIPRKGVLEFLRSLMLTADPETGFSLDIVGRNDMDSEYSKACEKLVLEGASKQHRIALVGALPHRDMRERFEQATLYVSASRMETFGISLQEARHFGLPIFAVNGGNSASHVIAGRTGEMHDTPKELGQFLGALLGNKARLQEYFQKAQASRPADTESWTQLASRLHSTLLKWAV